MRRLVESAEINADDVVLEVGGGTGGLTDLLVRRARQVLCVEIDRDLQTILEARFSECPGFGLIRGDVLRDKHQGILDTIRKEKQLSDDTRAKLKAAIEDYAKGFAA